MTSSAQNHQLFGVTAAPPPTPSVQSDRVSSPDAAEALSRLFNKLPPSLSLPPRLSPRTTSPPLISFSPQTPELLNNHLPSFSQLGFFQLTNHQIPSQLAQTAESESLSLFNLSKTQKQESFSKSWPLGYDDGDENNNGEEGSAESFCLDSSSSAEITESTQLSLTSLHEFARELERVGLDIVEALSCAMGFDKGLKEMGLRFSPLMWVSEGVVGDKQSGRFYPYIIALQYQIRFMKYSLLTDSGWVAVSPQVHSLLVMVGDIAQAWSNGKLKKVRGRPVPISGNDDDSRCITMSLLVTLPTDTSITISPLLSITSCSEKDNIGDTDQEEDGGEKLVFDTFSFDDYAWRVYHERFLFKDPLDRYHLH